MQVVERLTAGQAEYNHVLVVDGRDESFLHWVSIDLKAPFTYQSNPVKSAHIVLEPAALKAEAGQVVVVVQEPLVPPFISHVTPTPLVAKLGLIRRIITSSALSAPNPVIVFDAKSGVDVLVAVDVGLR
jgi:hypothetical protein